MSLAKFAKQWAILSKTSDRVCVAEYEGTKYVFVDGYPMTYWGASILLLQVTTPDTKLIRPLEWTKLHEQTRALGKDLNFAFAESKEAFVILAGLNKKLGENGRTSLSKVLEIFQTIDTEFVIPDNQPSVSLLSTSITI